jgi:hypothetical protein
MSPSWFRIPKGLFAESEALFLVTKLGCFTKMTQVLFSAMAVVEQLPHASVIDPDALMFTVSLERIGEISEDPFPGLPLVCFGYTAFFFPEFRGMR